MSKLSDLRSKGEQVTLSNGLQFEVSPVTIDEEADIAEYQEKEQFVKAITYMVKNVIKKGIPDATDEEINNLNKKDLQVVTERVLKVNGLTSSKNEEAMKSSKEN